jgi:hypothetical protein
MRILSPYNERKRIQRNDFRKDEKTNCEKKEAQLDGGVTAVL